MSLETPIKIRMLQRKLYQKAKEEPSYRFYLLYDKMYREDVLAHAYALVKSNQGAPGVDGQSFWGIESQGLEEWLSGIRGPSSPFNGSAISGRPCSRSILCRSSRVRYRGPANSLERSPASSSAAKWAAIVSCRMRLLIMKYLAGIEGLLSPSGQGFWIV